MIWKIWKKRKLNSENIRKMVWGKWAVVVVEVVVVVVEVVVVVVVVQVVVVAANFCKIIEINNVIMKIKWRGRGR
jgi:hypothetical protein